MHQVRAIWPPRALLAWSLNVRDAVYARGINDGLGCGECARFGRWSGRTRPALAQSLNVHDAVYARGINRLDRVITLANRALCRDALLTDNVPVSADARCLKFSTRRSHGR